MTLTKIPQKPRKCRRRPRLEYLETRYLLSVASDSSAITPLTDSSPVQDSASTSDLSDTQNASAPNDIRRSSPSTTASDESSIQVLPQSPGTINVLFPQPIDPFTLSGEDFDLLSVAADGTTTSLSTPFSSPLTEPSDLAAPTETVVLTVNQVLPDGHYRLVLLGGSSLAYDTAAGDQPVTDGMDDLVITDFEISAPLKGVELSDAKNIGTPNATPKVVSGQLDFATNPVAVDLYKFTLPAGHFWLAGMEVSATRGGGTLKTALSLFDSKGHVIATSTIGAIGDPLDPYLFDGLAAGTYYIGVSDVGNIPGQTGGYDPATGTPGTPSQDPLGGPFTLHVIATPADAPIHLVSSQFSIASKLSPNPFAVTLSFSGPLSLATFQTVSQGLPFQGIDLVDQTGKVWGTTPIGFANGQDTLTLLFDDHLPAGDYTLMIPQSGGVTDLAGQTPVARGEPSHVLETFTIAPPFGTVDPNNLGVFTRDTSTGISLEATLPGGASTTYWFGIPVADRYTFQFSSTASDPIIARLDGPDGFSLLLPPSSDQDIPEFLPAGVYNLTETNTGTSDAQIYTFIKPPASAWDRYWNNGLGQGPALNVTLVASPTSNPLPTDVNGFQTVTISPQLPVPSGGSSSGPVSGPNPGSPPPSSSPPQGTDPQSGSGSDAGHGGGSLSVPGSTAAGGTAGLILTLGTLVGNPSAAANQVSVVGPGTQTGTTALAFTGLGVPQGINYGFSSSGESVDGENVQNDQGLDEDLEPINGAIPLWAQMTSLSADDRVLLESEWPTRTGDILARWFSAIPGSFSLAGTGPVAAADGVPVRLAARIEPKKNDDSREQNEEVEEFEQAGIAAPLGVGLATVLLLKLRQPIRRWYGRHNAKARQQSSRPVGSPYARV